MLSTRSTPFALAATLALVAGCAGPVRQSNVAPAPGPGYVSSQDVQYGYVTRISMVDARRTSGAGAVIGGVVGAVVGNQFGSGSGRAAATGIGAVGGAIVGNEIEQNRASGQAYHVEVRMENGDIRIFDYWDLNGLRAGDRVRVVNGQLERY
ncbi:MAG TPA: glycine zipper 2TM domain-containing protein [Albitalea sp.]|nr:glycine zipper 2TM domain-containing protein [Albitalea sp.]